MKTMAHTSIKYGDEGWTSFVGVDLVLAFFTTQRSGLCRQRLEGNMLPHLQGQREKAVEKLTDHSLGHWRWRQEVPPKRRQRSPWPYFVKPPDKFNTKKWSITVKAQNQLENFRWPVMYWSTCSSWHVKMRIMHLNPLLATAALPVATRRLPPQYVDANWFLRWELFNINCELHTDCPRLTGAKLRRTVHLEHLF